jgi:hypothetical protein
MSNGASLITNPLFIATDSNGNPLAGGKVYTYQVGTLIPLATYTDATLTVPNTNPVILDEFGSAQIWLGPSIYKINVTDINNVQHPDYPIDNISTSPAFSGEFIGNLVIYNGHLGTIQTTSPTVQTLPGAGSGGSLGATLLAGSTDNAGSILLVCGSSSTASGSVVRLTLHTNYSTTAIMVCTYADSNASSPTLYVIPPTMANGYIDIAMMTAPPVGATYYINYIIIGY